jgi:hypothetical protein
VIAGSATDDVGRQAGERALAGARWFAVDGRWWLVATLGGVVLLAFAVRLWLWWWQARSGAVPPGDAEEYYRAALHILQGGYHDTGKWLRPPTYPALLALLLPLAGMEVSRALLLQAGVMSVGTLAFFALAAQLFGRSVGLIAGLIAALFVPLAAFASAMYAEALFVILMVLALAALDRALIGSRGGWALAAGALLGLATLTRAVGLFFIPLAALWLLLGLADSRQRTARLGTGSLVSSRLAARPLLLLLGAVLVIAPWTARNYAAHGRLIVVDTNGGISMWYGAVRSPEEKAARDTELFAVPNLADRQALALRWTAERALEAPAEFAGRMRFKVASLLLLQTRSYAVGDVISVGPDGSLVVQNAGELPLGPTLLADAQYVLVMLLGIVGVCFAPNPRRALPILLWVAVAVGLAALTIGHPRLRLPIVAAFIPFCAYAVAQLPRLWRNAWPDGTRHPLRDRRVYAALGGCLLFLALVGSTRYVAWLQGERYAFAARQELGAGDVERAEELLERARDTDPDNALRWVALAELALARGRYAEADALYREATEREGRGLYARGMRALLAPVLGSPETARQEVAAIDDYWRAGNDLYSWAWGAALADPPRRLVPGDPASIGHYAGFAPASFDLPNGRWTLGDGRVRLARTCGEVTLGLRGPAGRVLAVELEGGQRLASVTLNGGQQEARVSLAGVSGCEGMVATVLRLRSATGLLDLEQAPWHVGVALTEARLEP